MKISLSKFSSICHHLNAFLCSVSCRWWGWCEWGVCEWCQISSSCCHPSLMNWFDLFHGANFHLSVVADCGWYDPSLAWTVKPFIHPSLDLLNKQQSATNHPWSTQLQLLTHFNANCHFFFFAARTAFSARRKFYHSFSPSCARNATRKSKFKWFRLSVFSSKISPVKSPSFTSYPTIISMIWLCIALISLMKSCWPFTSLFSRHSHWNWMKKLFNSFSMNKPTIFLSTPKP